MNLMDQREIDRRLPAGLQLMDFGWDFCLADLLRIHGDLDRPYLEATARRLGLESDLTR